MSFPSILHRQCILKHPKHETHCPIIDAYMAQVSTHFASHGCNTIAVGEISTIVVYPIEVLCHSSSAAILLDLSGSLQLMSHNMKNLHLLSNIYLFILKHCSK